MTTIRPYSQQAPPVSTRKSLTSPALFPFTRFSKSTKPLSFTNPLSFIRHETSCALPRTGNKSAYIPTAIVYCEANFGDIDGKTANGLVRQSEKYRILSVLARKPAGLDAGMVLDDVPNAIPICHDLSEALRQAENIPDYFIFGMAPASGMLSIYERSVVLEAMAGGMNIVNGLHEFLNDDAEFVAASAKSKVPPNTI